MPGALRRRDRGALLLTDVFLVLSAFFASAVEMVEALTIVLAMGVTRSWRAALGGAGVAALALAAIIAVLGPALTTIPIDALRLVVGVLLLVFGLQWLRKAILRASGWRALRDEDAAFARQAAAAQGQTDWYAFTISFKGVLLEGLEVAFIVLTFGSAQENIPLAAAGAAAAAVVVVLAGVVVREPLSRVPENTLAFAVGVMLTTFGIFWGAEGVGVEWPGDEASLPAVLAFLLLLSVAFVNALRRTRVALA